MAKVMPKIFALFTAASMASLALPGMSGFVSELSIFLGLTASDAYTSVFKIVVILLAAVGLILTPIYLLSMLRVVFYGQNDTGLALDNFSIDAKPREIFIAVSLLIPVIAIGLYPKLITSTYDVTTVEIASKVREALPVIARQESAWTGLSTAWVAPQIEQADS